MSRADALHAHRLAMLHRQPAAYLERERPTVFGVYINFVVGPFFTGEFALGHAASAFGRLSE